MRNFRRVMLVVGGMVGCMAGGATLTVGCGGSTSTPSAEDGGGTTDGTLDQAAPDGNEDAADSSQIQQEASVDSTVEASDSGSADAAGEATDGGEGAALDGGSDAGTDADSGTDALADANDGGTGDASDAGATPPIFAFPGQVASALCGQIAACCLGQDASAFDMPGCIASVTPTGYSSTLGGSAGLLDSGTLAFDPVKAQACLTDISAIDCLDNQVSSTVQKNILRDCTAAITGTVGVGSPCTFTIQCAAGEYCDSPTDGGTGNCASLEGDGGSCYFGNHTFGLSEEACGFRRSGSADLRCNNANLVTGVANPSSSWTCTPQMDAGSPCNFNQDCLSELCDPGPTFGLFACVNSETFVYPSACATYLITDAGGGG